MTAPWTDGRTDETIFGSEREKKKEKERGELSDKKERGQSAATQSR